MLRSRAEIIALLRDNQAGLPETFFSNRSDESIIRWLFVDREGIQGLRLTEAGCTLLRILLDAYEFVLERPRVIDIVRLNHRLRTPYFVTANLLIVFDPDEAALLHLLGNDLTAFVGFGSE